MSKNKITSKTPKDKTEASFISPSALKLKQLVELSGNKNRMLTEEEIALLRKSKKEMANYYRDNRKLIK